MTSYIDLFKEAMDRSKRFGFAISDQPLDPEGTLLTERALKDFPYVILRGVGQLDEKQVVAQCLSIHHRALQPLSSYFGAEVFYTIGWVDDRTPHGMFKFDEYFIEKKIRDGHAPFTSMNIHAWITLPTMEIIDISLPTSIAVIQNKPEALGQVVAKKADEMSGFSYIPMLVGDGFLRNIGVLIEF